jgi:hypothetical protein
VIALTTWELAWNAFCAASTSTPSLFSLTPEMDERLFEAVEARLVAVVDAVVASATYVPMDPIMDW